jgi:hypothetical protein
MRGRRGLPPTRAPPPPDAAGGYTVLCTALRSRGVPSPAPAPRDSTSKGDGGSEAVDRAGTGTAGAAGGDPNPTVGAVRGLALGPSRASVPTGTATLEGTTSTTDDARFRVDNPRGVGSRATCCAAEDAVLGERATLAEATALRARAPNTMGEGANVTRRAFVARPVPAPSDGGVPGSRTGSKGGGAAMESSEPPAATSGPVAQHPSKTSSRTAGADSETYEAL